MLLFTTILSFSDTTTLSNQPRHYDRNSRLTSGAAQPYIQHCRHGCSIRDVGLQEGRLGIPHDEGDRSLCACLPILVRHRTATALAQHNRYIGLRQRWMPDETAERGHRLLPRCGTSWCPCTRHLSPEQRQLHHSGRRPVGIA